MDLKRKLEELEEDQDLLQRLFRTLRHKNAYVDELVDFIRDRHATLAQIKSFMDGAIPRDGSGKSPGLLNVHEEIDQLHSLPVALRDTTWVLNINRLCDIPLFSVPAHPWTSVTDDNEFVSRLVSLWFTWAHSRLDWVDRDLFLQDMKSGRLDSTFCTPFVVNAMLAEACVSSPELNTNPLL
jgi:hypothetical protein